jgi:hypothetical protein
MWRGQITHQAVQTCGKASKANEKKTEAIAQEAKEKFLRIRNFSRIIRRHSTV